MCNLSIKTLISDNLSNRSEQDIFLWFYEQVTDEKPGANLNFQYPFSRRPSFFQKIIDQIQYPNEKAFHAKNQCETAAM